MRSSRRASRARSPSRTWWRCRATPRASSPAANSRFRCRGALGTVTIEYKKYGVGLAFTPTVLGDGLINLKIEPEVSQIDTSHPVTVAGISVPPLIVRRASTTVELRDGQSFVIGGLLQSNEPERDQQQLPWLGDVPVLGALFRSAAYQKNETDLAIIVTPRLVRPARPGDVIKTPLDTTLPAERRRILPDGQDRRSRRAEARRSTAVAGAPFAGHMLDLPKGVRQCRRGQQLSAAWRWRRHRRRRLARRLLRHLFRPPRHRRARRRRRDGGQQGDAHGRSVAGLRGATATSPSTARRHAGRGRALPHRQGDPAGERDHHVDHAGAVSAGGASAQSTANSQASSAAARRPRQSNEHRAVRLAAIRYREQMPCE